MIDESPMEAARRIPGWLTALLFFTVVAALVVGIAWVYPPPDDDGAGASVSTTTVPGVDVVAPTDPPGDEPIADAAEVILPSVVHIQTASGLGSGVIYDSSGLIVTAGHVVDGSETVRVRFADGDQVTGTVVGTAPEVDIAVIRVDRTGLQAAEFRTDKPRVGQMAIAVGSPWGLASTVTAGIISAVDQTNCSQETCSSMVQTDAAINPGNSGGALVDRTGKVVGINVSIFSSSGANDGVGFAVPADIAIAYARSIVSGEPLETAFLGVQGENVNSEGQAGSVITSIVPDSGAEVAGLRVGDVVIGFGGVPILGFQDLIAQVRAHQPGEVVEVLILRDGEEMIVEVTLGVRTEDVG